jgi:hypothetical protein
MIFLPWICHFCKHGIFAKKMCVFILNCKDFLTNTKFKVAQRSMVISSHSTAQETDVHSTIIQEPN